MHLTRPLKVLNILRIVSTRLSPLCDEMSLAAESDERKLYLRLLGTRLFYFYMGKLVDLQSGLANGEQNSGLMNFDSVR